jgi:hypothetical protein
MMHWETLKYRLLRRERVRRVRRHAVAVFLVLAAAILCVSQLHAQSPRIPDAVRFYPDYRADYAAAVECTKTVSPAPYEGIVWMLVPRPNFVDPIQSGEEGKLANIGEWIGHSSMKGDTIYIANAYRNSWVPKHEIIHYLRHDGGHPKDGNRNLIFGETCHATWGYLSVDTTTIGPGKTEGGKETVWESEPGGGLHSAYRDTTTP